MNSLLLIIGLPNDLPENAQIEAEKTLLHICNKLSSNAKRIPGIEHIPPNVWLIPAENGLSFLRNALVLAGDSKFYCRILAFDNEPNWIQGVPAE